LKKTILTAAVALGLASTANAAWISYDLDNVKADAKGGSDSQAHYIRAGGTVAGFSTMMQARTASFDKGGMVHSLELTAGKQLGPISPFVGVGHDLGFNGSGSFQYGLLGLTAGVPLGKLYAYGGAKTRVNWDDNNPKQTVTFIGVSMPITKALSANVGASKSTQDIKETAIGAGLRVSF
jgi:opacity protein-like surface antigen